MKHVVPYSLFEDKSVNAERQEFLAQLQDKFDELDIEWQNLATARSQKLGTVELHLSPKDAWEFVTRSGWDNAMSPKARAKFDHTVQSVQNSKLADDLSSSPLPGSIQVYVLSAGMRGVGSTGRPAVSPFYSFGEGTDRAKGSFQAFLIRELAGLLTKIKIRKVRSCTDPAELRKYVSDPDWMVRSEVAQHPSASADLLAKLTTDRNEMVQRNVASNLKTPVDSLVRLSKKKEDDVVTLVAKNPNSPIETLAQLAGHPNSGVRYYVAMNPSSPVDVVVKLSRDKDEIVSNTAKHNPNFPEDLTDWALGGDDSWL